MIKANAFIGLCPLSTLGSRIKTGRACFCRTYNVGSGVRFGGDGFVEVLAATQTPTDKEWFQGTADAVRQYAWLFEDIKNRVVEDIIILSGDHL